MTSLATRDKNYNQKNYRLPKVRAMSSKGLNQIPEERGVRIKTALS